MTKIFIGSDHAGFDLKQDILNAEFNGLSFVDCGTHSSERTDYPTYAKKVCAEVLKNPNSFGVLICYTGIGMSIAANRHLGIRAALCATLSDVKLSRHHNNANVLVLGAHAISKNNAIEMINTFITTLFEAGRHLTRIQQIDNL